jgi:hypothetical protein
VRERVAFVIVFASLVFTSAPALVKLARRAWEMRGVRVNRPFAELRTTSEPLALICDPNETDPALFVNPRRGFSSISSTRRPAAC